MTIRNVFLATSLVLALSLSARASHAALIDAIVWSGDTSGAFQCRDFDCLSAAMTRSGARPEAIDFARRISSGRVPSWATKIVHYGIINLVDMSCAECRSQQFLFVSGSPPGLQISNVDRFQPELTRELDLDPTLRKLHPYALLMYMGEGFLGEYPYNGRGARFEFVDLVADCEACQPFTAVKFMIDFVNDQSAQFPDLKTHGFVPVSATKHAIWSGGSGE